MSLTIFHNPRCSKSRQTLAIIEEKGLRPEIVLYLETPLDEKQLRALCEQLGQAPEKIIRFKEDLAKELGICGDDHRSADEWLNILAQYPKLLERPIVTNGKKAIIGRPPENVLALIT